MHYATQPAPYIDLRFIMGSDEYQILHKLDTQRRKHKAYVYDGTGQALINSSRLTDVKRWVEAVAGADRAPTGARRRGGTLSPLRVGRPDDGDVCPGTGNPRRRAVGVIQKADGRNGRTGCSRR